jgi:glutaredoxin
MYRVYGKPVCPFCTKAKKLLERKGLEFEYFDITQDEDAREVVLSSGYRTVPIVYLASELVGGYEQLSTQLAS